MAQGRIALEECLKASENATSTVVKSAKAHKLSIVREVIAQYLETAERTQKIKSDLVLQTSASPIATLLDPQDLKRKAGKLSEAEAVVSSVTEQKEKLGFFLQQQMHGLHLPVEDGYQQQLLSLLLIAAEDKASLQPSKEDLRWMLDFAESEWFWADQIKPVPQVSMALQKTLKGQKEFYKLLVARDGKGCTDVATLFAQ